MTAKNEKSIHNRAYLSVRIHKHNNKDIMRKKIDSCMGELFVCLFELDELRGEF